MVSRAPPSGPQTEAWRAPASTFAFLASWKCGGQRARGTRGQLPGIWINQAREGKQPVLSLGLIV